MMALTVLAAGLYRERLDDIVIDQLSYSAPDGPLRDLQLVCDIHEWTSRVPFKYLDDLFIQVIDQRIILLITIFRRFF